MANQLENEPFELIFANPFAFGDGVYDKVLATAKRVGMAENQKNLRFLRQMSHPRVSRDDPCYAPGWNASNGEIAARGKHACYLLFGRDGHLVFRGRATYEQMESRVLALVRPNDR